MKSRTVLTEYALETELEDASRHHRRQDVVVIVVVDVDARTPLLDLILTHARR